MANSGRRSKHKWWRNGRGNWNARIIWYAEGEATEATDWDMPDNIRLEMTDCEREVQYFPRSLKDAQHVWFMFKRGAPQIGQPAVPFITDLLKLVEQAYPKGADDAHTDQA